jgi:membrane protease YdiL (CAAX protease family)
MFSSFFMHWDFAAILIFLGVAVPLLGRRRVRQLMQVPATTKEQRLTLYASTMAFQWLASAIIFWRATLHGFTASQLSLGFPRLFLTVALTVGLTALILLNQVVGLKRLASLPAASQGLVPQLAQKLFPHDSAERLAFFALVVTVAVCEEFIYRGFIQHLFQNLAGGSPYVAVFGSAAFFALAHLYQGRRGLISTFTIGVLFSTATAISLSLVPSIIAHFAADFVAGTLAPRYLGRAAALDVVEPARSPSEAASSNTMYIVI